MSDDARDDQPARVEDEYSLETTVHLVELPSAAMPGGDPPEQSWSFTLPGSLTVQDVRSLLAAPGQYLPPHALDKHYSSLEWGASGAETEFIVQVAQGLSVDLMLTGLVVLARKAKRQFGIDKLHDVELDRDAACHRATYGLAVTYDSVTRKDLLVVSESQSLNPLCFSFEFADDSHRYEAEVTLTDEGVAVTRVKWTRGNGHVAS